MVNKRDREAVSGQGRVHRYGETLKGAGWHSLKAAERACSSHSAQQNGWLINGQKSTPALTQPTLKAFLSPSSDFYNYFDGEAALQASRKRGRRRWREHVERRGGESPNCFLDRPNLSVRYLGTIAADGGLEWTSVTRGVALDGFVPCFGLTLAGLHWGLEDCLLRAVWGLLFSSTSRTRHSYGELERRVESGQPCGPLPPPPNWFPTFSSYVCL